MPINSQILGAYLKDLTFLYYGYSTSYTNIIFGGTASYSYEVAFLMNMD